MRWSLTIIEMEREILTSLGYGIYSVIEHPHKFVFYYVRYLEPATGLYNELAQLAWNILNDIHRLPVCVQHNSNIIASAAIYLAARMFEIKLPENPGKHFLYCYFSII